MVTGVGVFQFVDRLVCMSADIGGVDFSSAAWLAVEEAAVVSCGSDKG